MITFIELPSLSVHASGFATGLFFVTPNLVGCNIFVAHDPGNGGMESGTLLLSTHSVKKGTRVHCLFTGQYNTKGYGTFTDVILLIMSSTS